MSAHKTRRRLPAEREPMPGGGNETTDTHTELNFSGKTQGRDITSRGRTANKLAGRPAAAFFFLGMPQPHSFHLL